MATGRRHYYVTKTAIKVFFVGTCESYIDTQEKVNRWLAEKEGITVVSMCNVGYKLIITYSTQEMKLLSGY